MLPWQYPFFWDNGLFLFRILLLCFLWLAWIFNDAVTGERTWLKVVSHTKQDSSYRKRPHMVLFTFNPSWKQKDPCLKRAPLWCPEWSPRLTSGTYVSLLQQYKTLLSYSIVSRHIMYQNRDWDVVRVSGWGSRGVGWGGRKLIVPSDCYLSWSKCVSPSSKHPF